ncbi:aldehyde dehydrogenase family protein [Arthrobacter sp. MYb224]|uniref:aldehyde dehydrogenase family protein n=1 Tax=unclassified Arthrobacter TaxID=235627 RepID=UPI000CFBB351|nr:MULTISPECIES: aldehyde dehydrogenase family protein [unclassified Arthrobacter]PQZ97725.1 aldehyde dehydrogenase family protein [Arthrobacter sp. MYb224]PRA04043.1 aldehyde dehydrogenase family protein [Arthrobacter sp. MYb229]PRB52045.1 aldehyde dehydrogenase family protein [Arthrobacter sp. MYb216]
MGLFTSNPLPDPVGDAAPPVDEHPSRITEVLGHLRRSADTRITHPRRFRAQQLRALEKMLAERTGEFLDALAEDLGKSATEAKFSEIDVVRSEIDHAQRHLSEWMDSTAVKVPLALQPAMAKVEPRPLGVVLIIGPWNYPLQLMLAPLVAAIAAGNAAVLKPSELAPATSGVLAKLLPMYLDARVYAVLEGGVDTATELLAARWDHIFFTGGQQVARVVAEAAAKQLTPTTLELGGKSPAVVDNNSLPTAKRLAYAKFMNTGQTCVAPDYVLSFGDTDALISRLGQAIAGFYGKDPINHPDYGRIVSRKHFDRLVGMLDSGEVVHGGDYDADTLRIAPTIMRHVDLGSRLMQEEIFGPILPVIEVASFDEALEFIASRPSPLAAYLMSESPRLQSIFSDRVRAGAIVHNAPMAQAVVPSLPFGGVGASGMGSYHGKYGFDRLSQIRSELSKTTVIDTLSAIYPPYTWAKRKIIDRLL